MAFISQGCDQGGEKAPQHGSLSDHHNGCHVEMQSHTTFGCRSMATMSARLQWPMASDDIELMLLMESPDFFIPASSEVSPFSGF